MDNGTNDTRKKDDDGIRKGSVSRRDFLRMAGVAGATVAAAGGLGGLLAACGSGTTTTTGASSTVTTAGSTTTAASTATTTATTAAASTTTASTQASAGPATGAPIKIGVLAAQTGPAAPAWPAVQQGLELEVDAFNQAGGANGRPVQLDVLDDKSDTSTDVADFTKMITQDNVTAVIGPLTQPGGEAIKPLAEKYGVPVLTFGPTLADMKVLDKFKWFFYTSESANDSQGALLVQIKAAGWKNILGIGDQLPINQETLELLKGDSAGAKITAMSDAIPLSMTDLTPIVNKIYAQYKSLQPDVIFSLTAVSQTPQIVKGLRGMGVTVPIQAGPLSAHPALFALGPDVVEGTLLLGCGLTNPSQLPDDYPGKAHMADVAARFQAKYNSVATIFAANGLDSFDILAEGLKVGGDDKEKIRSTIENLTFNGVQGTFKYSPTDHKGIHGGFAEWSAKGGQFTFVRPLN